MRKIPPGVQLLDVRQSFNMIKNSLSIIALFVKKITVLNVKHNIILEWHVKNIEGIRSNKKMIENFKNSSKGLSLNNAQAASFGLKGLKDVHQ